MEYKKIAYVTIKIFLEEDLTDDEIQGIGEEMEYELRHQWIKSTEVIEIK